MSGISNESNTHDITSRAGRTIHQAEQRTISDVSSDPVAPAVDSDTLEPEVQRPPKASSENPLTGAFGPIRRISR